jgi:uncharacterized protein (DUF1015 family)
MPAVFPFRAVQYKKGGGAAHPIGGWVQREEGREAGPKEAVIDISSSVAPPYDVLDARAKQALLSKDQHNIVAIDLPHVPAKELGPPATYQQAAATYRQWLEKGILAQRPQPAIFAYRQTFRSAASAADGPIGRPYQRSGMCCTVETVPFGPRQGGGILPHEETFSGPKEDRMALMRAMRMQLSPIFGLFADEPGAASGLLQEVRASRAADMKATTADPGGGILHEVWTITDEETIRRYQDALAGEDIFIADGHHRYTTGLNYLKELESEMRGGVPADHPARRCMMVLVSMSDPGLVIWPTHRVLGGMRGYSMARLLEALAPLCEIRDLGTDLTQVEPALLEAGRRPCVLGLYDHESRRCAVANFKDTDPLAMRFPAKPVEWRQLDVALIQHIVVEQICQPLLNDDRPVKWAFPHTIDEIIQIGLGRETGAGGGADFKAQLSVIVRPTPLDSVRAVSRAGELMPQKSTFFYPKLATGLFLNPLE